MQSTSGCSMAAITRSVIARREILNEVWTLAITQSSSASRSSVVVERAVGEDVHLRAGEQPKAAAARVELAHLLDPLRQPLRGDVVAEAVAGRVVGDREVGVAAGPRGLRHLLERVVAVGDRRVAVEVAPDVLQRDQLRQRARRRGCDLAVGLAQLGLDVGEAEALVHLGLGRVASRPRRCAVSVIPCSETESSIRYGSLAQLDVVLGRPGEVLEQVPVGSGRDDPQVDGDPVVGRDPSARPRPRSPWSPPGDGPRAPAPSAAGSLAVAIRSMSWQVSVRRRAEPATSTASLAGWARRSCASCSATGSTSESSSRSPGAPSVELAERRQHVLLGLRPEALELADPLLLGGGAQLLEARDAELVVEAARRLRAHPGDHGHLDQRGRELSLQLRRGGDLAAVEQRQDLLLQRLADAGQLGRPAGTGEVLDRDGALPDHSGRLAVGEHAVPDRPVELVQRRQLGQGIGDLGVSHAPNLFR